MNRYELDSLHNLFVFNGYFSEIYVNLLWNNLLENTEISTLYFSEHDCNSPLINQNDFIFVSVFFFFGCATRLVGS